MVSPWMVRGLWFAASGAALEAARRFPRPSVGGGALETCRRVVRGVERIEDRIRGGTLPTDEDWRVLEELPPPWGILLGNALRDLRSSGGEVLPTLARARALAESEERTLWTARERSGQAMAQAVALTGLAPLAGWALFPLVPGLESHVVEWRWACGLATLWSAAGALWLNRLAERARWGGLRGQLRSWPRVFSCAGERLLAKIRGGLPPDLGWEEAHRILQAAGDLLGTPGIENAWGASVWLGEGRMSGGAAERALRSVPERLRAAIRVSLMEGVPCHARIESALDAFRRELDGICSRELARLPVRSLQPLFIFQAPALLGLVAAALCLALVDG
ncbi:MAG TPA: hypothetical protein VL588_06590 [Bdellovibrionota bacterium]|jgi:hypothetical protein|nr:hypothetical protein [Bdellovibrionota bacterium]